jgi:hypothetical protein
MMRERTTISTTSLTTAVCNFAGLKMTPRLDQTCWMDYRNGSGSGSRGRSRGRGKEGAAAVREVKRERRGGGRGSKIG